MTRLSLVLGWSICLSLLLLAPPAARADFTYTEDHDTEIGTIRMTVTPAAEPVPALKYRLMARDIELRAGNAAPFYYRALLESPNAMEQIRKKFPDDEYDQWYWGDPHIPSSRLPLEKLREADRVASGLIDDQLAEATSRRDCDWQLNLEELRGMDVWSIVLDEFQTSRDLSRMLAVRARLAVAEGRYQDALAAMRMNFRLGTDVAREPLLVCGLIGIAEAGLARASVLDLIAAPDSPNLYWALAELPQPLIDVRPAMRFEMGFGPRMCPFMLDAETADHSPAEWNRLYTQAVRDLSLQDGGPFHGLNELGAGLAATGYGLMGYSHAKAQLIAQGLDAQKVEKMAVGQVMAIYTERKYQQFADDFEKLWYLPFWEMRSRYDEVLQRLQKAGPLEGGADREVLPLVSQLMPAMEACRTAQTRLDRDVAALRIIEALRMYAAGHAGGLPKSLDEITEVPVPPNPATGQPFVYRLEGDTAVLELPESDGIPDDCERRFEIQISRNNEAADERR